MTFNPTPLDGSTPPIPMSSAIVPGDKTPRPIRGGPAVVDSQGNTITDVAIYAYDGDNETFGAKADVAVTDSTQTTKTHMAFLKGLVKIGADVWDSINHRLNTTIQVTAGTAIAVGNNAVPVLPVAAQGYVAAYGSNAAALTSLTDYSFKWGAAGTTQVNHVMIQNNTTANLNFELDAAATAGSPVLAPGQMGFFDVQTLSVHLFQAGTPNVGGSSAGNIVVRGWL